MEDDRDFALRAIDRILCDLVERQVGQLLDHAEEEDRELWQELRRLYADIIREELAMARECEEAR